MTLRIAFSGLAHSHPYTDAANALALGATITGVTDRDPDRGAAFAQQFGCANHDEIANLIADAPDLVIATPHPDHLLSVASELASAGVPVFFNKSVAADALGIVAFDGAVSPIAPGLVGTASVLRFAPSLHAFRLSLTGDILALNVSVQHDNSLFQTPSRRWQDDPSSGGGTMITVGIHAWEIIDLLLPGATITSASGWTRKRAGSATLSEDLGSVNGSIRSPTSNVAGASKQIPFGVLVSGVPGPDRYSLEVITTTGVHSLLLGGADPNFSYGFMGLMQELIRLVPKGQMPAPWSAARTVVSNAVLAASIAREHV